MSNGIVLENLNSATDAVALAGPVVDFDIPANDPAKKRRCAMFLHIGGAGTLVFKAAGGYTVTMHGIRPGRILPIQAANLVAAGSTVNNVTILYGGQR